MHFSKSVIAVTASIVSVGLAADPLSFTSWPKEPLKAGKPVTLTWTGADPDQPVTILLRQGSSGDLQAVKPITTSSKGGSFTWTPDSDVKDGDTYAFQISQKDQTNYTALLKSAGKPAADDPDAKDTTSETGTAASTATATGTTTGTNTSTNTGTNTGTTTGATTGATTGTTDTTSAPSTSTTGGTTEATHTTMTSTTSKALISSSASASGSPSSSAVASSTDSLRATRTEVVNGKEASSTGTSQTGAASIPQYSVQLVIGIVGLLAYLV